MDKVLERLRVRDEACRRMREASGNVTDSRPFVSLLYMLLRDGDVSPGRIEELSNPVVGVTSYTNGWLAKYCQDVADRLGVKE